CAMRRGSPESRSAARRAERYGSPLSVGSSAFLSGGVRKSTRPSGAPEDLVERFVVATVVSGFIARALEREAAAFDLRAPWELVDSDLGGLAEVLLRRDVGARLAPVAFFLSAPARGRFVVTFLLPDFFFKE